MAAPTVSEELPPDDEPARAPLYLLMVGPGITSTHPLPSTGSLLLGRADDADVRVVDERASRSHARLHLGSALELEDLGSANGTRVRDQPVRPGDRVAIAPGDAIGIGNTFLVVQRRAPSARPRRVWPHGYFEARLIEECGRAESARSAFALVRLHVDSRAFPESVETLVAARLRPGDLLGRYGPNEYEILLVDTDRAYAEALATHVLEALAREGVGGRTGLAVFPTDGTSPGALFAHACALVRGSDEAEAQERIIRSPLMRGLYEKAGRLAAGDVPLLIVGENGSGKEVLARWIHERSPRARGPFVAVNSGAFTESLLASELFGHEKGAFSGAVAAKQGLLEVANGGTVFLDELGEMAASVQVALLRAIDNGEILPVGATRPRRIDVRFIGATNVELEEEVAEGRFREDLFHRLGGDPLVVPPLRDRPEEIEPIARQFLEALARQMRRPPPALSSEAVALLRAHGWSGNIRELRNAVERALLHCAGSVIGPEHLSARLRGEVRPGARLRPSAEPPPTKDPAEWRTRQRDIEKQAMIEALERCAWNQTRAAELMEMPRRTFCKRMKEYGIRGPRSTR